MEKDVNGKERACLNEGNVGPFSFLKEKGPTCGKKAYLGKKRGGIWYLSKRNIFVWIEIIKKCIGKKLGAGSPPSPHTPAIAIPGQKFKEEFKAEYGSMHVS